MRIAKALVVAAALLGLTGRAVAQEYVTVHRNPAGTVLRDTVAGGVLGSAVAGGIILYNMGIQNHSDYDWGRTLAWGAVIGLGAGLVLGVVDATANADVSPNPLQRSAHDGLSTSLDLRSRDQSNAVAAPLVLRHF